MGRPFLRYTVGHHQPIISPEFDVYERSILSLPPMAVISYEGTMLGAILFTVLGVIFESRLPKLKEGLYDTRITEGYIGVLVNTEETEHDRVQLMLNQTGAVDVKR